MDLLGSSSNNETTQESQNLSLSLSSVSFTQEPLNPTLLNMGFDYTFDPSSAYLNQSCSRLCGTESFAAIGCSKYLEPTQSLLEEMISVGGKDIDITNQKYMEKLSRGSRNGSFSLSSKLKQEVSFSNSGDYVKLLKFIALLEEVETKYEEYCQRMEEMVSSFEAIAGLGSGKSYTSLALQAMSKHFYSLRKTILSQIHATKQKMDKDMPKISSRLSQLSIFDRQNQSSLQKLQEWRPIRGLPETSVTVLRAWLFDHFLHPYPNDSEKLVLASQTGLSKKQVSNWFVNARGRLWKPMIEEIYKEEFGDSSTESDQLLISSSITREGEEDSAEDPREGEEDCAEGLC
ncbi:Transcription factor MEIS1 [Handroanthus impetiginosus]|uniref:Transcription factor MEIS1 n=1 Tax=Handroanthus impetiginosus TaxID=429701 RepID=A0A2G9HW03_9LAMI|nr:Transcription factor MEIS1 [Handroanthus impetiginosus]